MNDFYKDLKKQLKSKGINIINTDYYEHIQYWKYWYNGYCPDFHTYNVKLANGTTSQKERLTMNMPKKVCEDRTKLIWSENVTIELGSAEKTKKLWNVLDSKKNNFSIMMPRQLEMGFALGTSGFSEYKDENGNTIIEYITDAMNIIPYSYDNYNITGMCVLDQFTKTEKDKIYYYTHITYHEYENGTYTKLNELYKSKDSNYLGKEVPFNDMFPNVKETTVYENIDTPHFQIFRPNIANNFDIDTPMGLSILANNIDRFKSIDIKYDSFANEYISGKKRILVDRKALKGTPQVDENGNVISVLYFDKDDDTYVAINGMEDQPIKDIDFNIRYKEHIEGINNDLSWLGANLGFGESFYSLSGSRVKTATEVLSEDSEAYRTMQSDSIVLKDVIFDIIKSICYLEGIEVTNEEIKIELDVSRFKNETALQERYEREVNQGLISKVEYRMMVYKEDEETARNKINQIRQENPSVTELLGE